MVNVIFKMLVKTRLVNLEMRKMDYIFYKQQIFMMLLLLFLLPEAHVTNSIIWHARMGHVPAKILQMLHVHYTNKILDVCERCFLAKQSRLMFPQITSLGACLFDLVHADILGPYRFKTQHNCNMFLTLVEDKSITTWVYDCLIRHQSIY